MTKCAYHSERDPVSACVNCGKLICEECRKTIEGKIYCEPCSRLIAENTSGQGSLAVVPKEVKGWNWGAFLLSWIWGIGNHVWLALLALIPYAGVIMNFVLGVKGSEWAWQNRRWDSIEHFKRTQRTWAKWGIGIVIAIIILGIFAAVVIPNVGRFLAR